MPTYQIIEAGESRSFPGDHAFLDHASAHGASRVFIGTSAGKAFAAAGELGACPFVAIELDLECLGVHTGEAAGNEGSNVVGFARFRLGQADPSPLVELVRQPKTRPEALAAARSAFEAAGLKVAVCGDFPGRIVNRLIRPYLNAALRRLDEGLASAIDLDKTLCLGLGYPEGPISLLERTGLAEHHDVTLALYQALGQEPYAPARRAQVARRALQNG
ncbi:3-hydroxyacyl-CoA dehydrogenase family protein [Burkholderia pseudomultivorans]|uniref:3-hydroxyacyl-CoA dehydrogenase n=1 Tax=Burkholderia pseudomultivorans TaxID=1207504 RepID=A0A132EC41_9BURK|nr:3-hydroxyacyl-CoA dehydrogenase family protein [Burkholderia pseudomultivorans]KWF24850.1 3-hydroxyacyl-CoA dehydrogenase [Burkholderia pseudomultivorans]